MTVEWQICKLLMKAKKCSVFNKCSYLCCIIF